MLRLPRVSALALVLLAAACAPVATPSADEAASEAITSNDASVMDFRFRGEVVTPKTTPARQAVLTQLQYAEGILTNAENASGQVGLVTLTDVKETVHGDQKTVAYSAVLPVLWPKGGWLSGRPPRSYELSLPRDVTSLDGFNAKYDGACGRAHYGRDSFWHDFNPRSATCRLDDADVQRSHVDVVNHAGTTTGKYPEYDRIWADDSLDIVAVYGIIDPSRDVARDEGTREMETFLSETRSMLSRGTRTDSPPSASILRDATVTGEATVHGKTRKVKVTALLVRSVIGADEDFDERYGAASEKADYIVFSGHSGMGTNINGLARITRVVKDKYQLVYMNGCQSFAYLDPALPEKKTEVNGAVADPHGTKFLDVIANGLPAYGDNGKTSLTIYKAILEADRPRSYNELLEEFSARNLVAVFGEDDNTFRP